VFALWDTPAFVRAVARAQQPRANKKATPLVLAPGGAHPHDASPRAGRETWSYGPAVQNDTKGSYLEVDLIVPELIGDSESWKSFAWYSAYEDLDRPQDAILMKWGERSYTLFFPRAASNP
jgi:hypothetical protein